MCLIFTCGEHTFRKEVEGYEGVVCRCHNCGNYSGHVIKQNPWFTFCFIVSLSRNSVSESGADCATVACDSPLDQGLYRCLVPYLQLSATARASSRRPGYEGRRWRWRRSYDASSARPTGGANERLAESWAGTAAADEIWLRTTV